MKRANVSGDDVSSTSPSSTASLSPAHSPLCFSTKQSPPPAPLPPHPYPQQCVTLSPDHGVTASSQAATPPPLQPAVAAAVTTAPSPTPASGTTSPELLVDLPAEPRRRAGSRSKGETASRRTITLYRVCLFIDPTIQYFHAERNTAMTVLRHVMYFRFVDDVIRHVFA